MTEGAGEGGLILGQNCVTSFMNAPLRLFMTKLNIGAMTWVENGIGLRARP